MSLKQKLLVFLTVVFLALASLFVFRDAMLQYVVAHEQGVMLKRYGMQLSVGRIGFSGIRNIYIDKVGIVPTNADTLLYISKVEAKLSLTLLFRLRIGFTELFVDTILINVVKYDDGTGNYSKLLKGRKKDSVTVAVEPLQFNERVTVILNKAQNIFNEHVVIHALRLSYSSSGQTELLSIPELFYNKKILKASLVTASSDGVGSYSMEGTVDALNDSYDFIIRNTGIKKTSWPFFDLYDNFHVGFDKLQVKLQADPDAGVIPINARLDFTGLRLNQWRISPVDVTFGDLQMDFKMLVDDHRFTLDKGTSVRFAKLPIIIEGFYENKPDVRFVAKVAFDCKAGDFFSSLPRGMFNTIQGIQASGDLHYSLNFDLNKSRPDDVVFASSFKKEHFRIIQFGQEYFPIINSDFQFTAMDKDRPVRSIFVGHANPMFISYEAISNYLKNAVLTSEDPGFMTHNGFVESSFRESIATNIKEGRFARGGSTISMQLVKNLFLSRNKTISRKLEEALIVWLIEQNRLVSKERMFEVYLNIIEWGPGVYGIGEASSFYFNKKPHELNLPESVFLASIIPHPKYYKYMFDSTGTLKENQRGFYTLIANRLLSRNLISQEEIDKSDTILKVTGEAFKLIVPLDSLPNDSLELEEMIITE